MSGVKFFISIVNPAEYEPITVDGHDILQVDSTHGWIGSNHAVGYHNFVNALKRCDELSRGMCRDFSLLCMGMGGD